MKKYPYYYITRSLDGQKWDLCYVHSGVARVEIVSQWPTREGARKAKRRLEER